MCIKSGNFLETRLFLRIQKSETQWNGPSHLADTVSSVKTPAPDKRIPDLIGFLEGTLCDLHKALTAPYLLNAIVWVSQYEA